MKKVFFFCITTLWIIPSGLQAQFIHFQMSVEPEMSTDMVQSLNFGNLVIDSGMQRIEKGSPDMGIFEIRGLRAQNVAVTLNPPKELQHTNPEIDEHIPVDLEASYTTSSLDIENARPFSGNNAWFTIGDERNRDLQNQSWLSAYVYVYGNISIKDVPEGSYEGVLVLKIEYL